MTTGTSAVIQVRPSELADVLTADFQRRAEPQFAWKSCISQFLALPGLRGFWPMSSMNDSGNAIDLSGQGRTLTNTNTAEFGYSNLVPFAQLDSSSLQYFARADEAGLDISGTESYVQSDLRGLTLGGWFYTTSASSHQGLISKEAWVNNLAYHLRLVSSAPNVSISDDGLNWQSSVSGGTVSSNAWYFIAGRFRPSTEVALFQNGVWYTDTTAIPASINNTGSNLEIGRFQSGVASWVYLDGRASMCFLCAAALSNAIINQLYEQSRVAYGVL